MKPVSSSGSYILINLILAGVILFILGYSLFYSPDNNKYPVICIHEKITGDPCPSCGMSHAFSLIVRGRPGEAMAWNSYSPVLFLFFVVQLVMRAGVSLRIRRSDALCSRKIAIADTLVSGLMTLAVFFPFLRILWLSLH